MLAAQCTLELDGAIRRSRVAWVLVIGLLAGQPSWAQTDDGSAEVSDGTTREVESDAVTDRASLDEAGEADESDPFDEFPEDYDEESDEEAWGEIDEEELEDFDDSIEVLRVTASSKTGQALQIDDAQSEISFGGEDLQNLGVSNLSDVAAFVPNLNITTTDSTAPTFFIRGVGLADFSSNAPGAIAIFRDGVPMASPAIQQTPVFDLGPRGLEVLRGPQATGPYRNASGGAIVVTSQEPVDGFQSRAFFEAGNFARVKAEGAVNVPIVGEALLSRVSFVVERGNGFRENGCGGVESSLEEREADPSNPEWRNQSVCPNGADKPLKNLGFGNFISSVEGGQPSDGIGDYLNWAARGQLLWDPEFDGLNMKWLLSGHGSQVDQDPALGQAFGTSGAEGISFSTVQGYTDPDVAEELAELKSPVPSPEDTAAAHAELDQRLARRLDIRPYRGDYNEIGYTRQSSAGGLLRGEFDFESVSLRSVTAIEWYDRARDTDNDFTPQILFETTIDDGAQQISQELALEGDLYELPVHWQAGGLVLYESLESDSEIRLTENIASWSLIDYTQRTFSALAWAEMAIDWERFTLEGGARYNYESKDYKIVQTFNPYPQRPIPPTSVVEQETNPTWDHVTGDAILSYRINDEVNTYFKFSHGWKGGHINNQLNRVIQQVELVEPETLNAYELGLRGSWLEERLYVGVAGFYYDYENYQVFQVISQQGQAPFLQILNAQGATNAGIELDLVARPLAGLVDGFWDGLSIDLRFGWLYSEFDEFKFNWFSTRTEQCGTGCIETIVIENEVDYTGNRLPSSPEYALSGGVEWPLDFDNLGIVTPRYDFAWTDDIYFDGSGGRGFPDPATGEQYMPENTIGQAAYVLHNARLAWRDPDGRIEVAFWVRNFMDKRYKTMVYDSSNFYNLVGNYVADPRTWGASVAMEFK